MAVAQPVRHQDLSALARRPRDRSVFVFRLRERGLRFLRQDPLRSARAAAALEALRGAGRCADGRSARRGVREPRLQRGAETEDFAHDAADRAGDARRARRSRLDERGDEREGPGKAARNRQQDRIPGQVARLRTFEDRAQRCFRQRGARQPVRGAAEARQDRQAARPRRVGHDAADGQCLLQRAHERHQFRRGGAAAALVRPENGRCAQLRQHRRHDRPRADARVRRRGAPLRRARQSQGLVDGEGREGVQRSRAVHRRPVRAVHDRRRHPDQQQADRRRGHRRPGRPRARVARLESRDGRRQTREPRRLHARAALLRRLRAMGLRAPPPGGPARAGPDRCALARQVPCQRPGGEHARVRARVLVQGRSADGARKPLPRVVMEDSVAESTAPGLSPLILACLAATWLIWGSTYLAIKWALISLPPFFQMGTRFLVAGGLLMAWMRLVRKASWPTRAQWLHALWVGTLMLGGGMGSTAYAEQSVGSGLAVAFIAVVPIMIAAINMLWKVYPSRLEATGIAVGLAGVLMLTQGAGFRASPQGLAAIAVACLSWSAGSVLSQRRWTLAPGATGFASEMLCGGCALMLLSLASCEPAAVG